MTDRPESDYRPFSSSYPEPHDSPWEAELSDGATQPPETDRPPPDTDPDLTSETNATASADPARREPRCDSDYYDNEEDDPFISHISIGADDSDHEATSECESVWMTVTHSAQSNQLMIGEEEFFHQRLVLHKLQVHKFSISTKSLNDGHPISKAALLCHAEQYINIQTLPDNHNEEGRKFYYRGDFIASRQECRKFGTVVAYKNTTPFRRLLPPHVDAAISDLESAWKHYYGDHDIIWHRRWNEGKLSGVSEVNVTVPLLLAVLYRSSFVSIRYDHYTTLLHIKALPCCECVPHSIYVLRTMACLTRLHQDICDTLVRVRKRNHHVFERTMNDMYESTSKYLVYHCDDQRQLSYKHIELPHFIVIKLYRGDEVVTLAMLYQQVPPYYFGIPVSLHDGEVTTPDEYQDLILSSGEHDEISKYFIVIIEKVNQKLAEERETFFAKHRPDLRNNDRLLQIYPYRFNENNEPDCSCRHLAITIHG